ncbi:MAG: sigma 54-interacting transcriptional regulator [Deltaproteobacteria bacterium]
MGTPYEPREHIQPVEIAPQAEGVLDHREITVQSYETTVPFDFDSLSSRIEQAWLAPSSLLGLFQRTPLTGKDEIHVVLGLQGALSVRAYDYDERRPLYYSWKGVVVETVAVRYLRDKQGLIRFTTFGGGVRITEEKLHEFNEGFLKIPKDAASKRPFDLEKLRALCFGRFPERLYLLRFSNPAAQEYRSIDHALFQSRKYIDPKAERLREIQADPQVKIESFDSDIQVATTDLAAPVEVRFAIRGLSGALRLRFPKVQYSAQLKTVEEQVRIFYRLVDETVSSVLDADYYARRRLTFAELEMNPEFPEFADTGPYREVLRAAEEQEKYFAKFDVGAPRQEWLPHLRAIDELLASNEMEPDVVARIGELADRDPGQALRLLIACAADARLRRVGAVAASVLAAKLQMLDAGLRAQVEHALLAWAIAHEEGSWDIDLDVGVVQVGALRWMVEDLDLDALPAVLWKMVGVLHGKLKASSGDSAMDLRKYAWCMDAAKELPASDARIHSALRLVAAGRVPRSPKEGRGVLKEPVADLSTLDDAVLDQFGLPLWPCFRAQRKDGAVVLSNEGVGAALAVARRTQGAGRDGEVRPFDLLAGESISLPIAGGATEVEATFQKFGTVHGVTIHVTGDAVASTAQVRRLPAAINRKRIEKQREHRKTIDATGKVIGSSPALLEVFEHIHHANTLDGGAPVLLLGESGVGKTHFARLLHDSSSRASRPFKAVNAGGGGGDLNIQRGEWIGYGRGHGIAGIDTKGKPGHLMEVNGGTLFVDEFAVFSQGLQVIFLSVLERRAVEKVGGDSFTPDVRCVLATNEDLDAAVERGQLRRDLLARIPVQIRIPPLRERRGDVLLLAKHFAGDDGPMTERCLIALLRHDWPDNVRELASVVAKAVARKKINGAGAVDVEHVDLSDAVVAEARALPEEDCRRELWGLADEIAHAEGFEPGAGLQRRAGEILGVGEAQASKMYAAFGLSQARAG